MPSYSVDDFRPTESKRLNRINVVRETADITLETYNRIALRDHGLADPVFLLSGGIEAFVDVYFQNVALFKVRNDYENKQRINQHKICALLLKTCFTLKWQSLFGRQENSVSDDFMEKLHNEFSFTLICAFAGAGKSIGKSDVERDFQICMHQKAFMPDEWACWMMTAFVTAYGSTVDCDE